MQKALRVLLVVAIVASLVQVFDIAVELIRPAEYPSEAGPATFAQQTLVRWMVYWPSGLVILVAGLLVRKRAVLLGDSFTIGGVYLMLLGNNGGLWAIGNEIGRLATSIVTLAVLVLIALRLNKQLKSREIAEEQLWTESHAGNSERT